MRPLRILFVLLSLLVAMGVTPAFGQIWPPWCYESGNTCCCAMLPPMPPSNVSNCLFEMRECCETCYVKPPQEDGMAPLGIRVKEPPTMEKINSTVCGILRKDAPPVTGADFERNLKRLSKFLQDGANRRAALVDWNLYPSTAMTFDRFEVWKMGIIANHLGSPMKGGGVDPPTPDAQDTLWDAVLFVIVPETYANIRSTRK